MANYMDEDDQLVIERLVASNTAQQLAEELVRRCACTWDLIIERLDGAPPILECDYHRGLRERTKR